MSEFTFRPYQRKDFKRCSEIMTTTWVDHTNFPGVKSVLFFYENFLRMEMIDATYKEVVVNEKDEVMGFFLASSPFSFIQKIVHRYKVLGYSIRTLFYILLHYYGNIKNAFAKFKLFSEGRNTIFADYDQDAEILLFILSAETRGHGIGKQLMNHFYDFCREKGIHKIILLTDSSCDVSYYDHNGFTRHCAICNGFFPDPEKGNNLFSYTIELE